MISALPYVFAFRDHYRSKEPRFHIPRLGVSKYMYEGTRDIPHARPQTAYRHAGNALDGSQCGGVEGFSKPVAVKF